MDPRVSVLMPVRDGARFLREAVESILGQTFRDWELVAVDDGSTDGSRAILERYARVDGRVRVLSRPATGIVGALNDGLRECRGEYLARMDADDVSMPERLELQVAHMEAHPDCAGVGAWVTFVDPQGWPLFRWEMATGHEDIIRELLGGGNGGLVHPAMMFRLEIVRRVGGYDPEYEWVEDVELFHRLASVGRLSVLPRVLLRYRQHARSVNRMRVGGERDARRSRAIDRFRAASGAGPQRACDGVRGTVAAPEPATVAGPHGRWAMWACESGFTASACKHAFLAVLRERGSPSSWKHAKCVVGWLRGQILASLRGWGSGG